MADKRKTFLESLLGAKPADELRDAVKTAQQKLDNAKIERKEEGEMMPESSDMSKAAAASVLQALTDAGVVDAILAAEGSSVKTPEELAMLVIKAVATVVDAEAEAEPPAEAGKEKPDEDAVTKELLDQFSSYIESTTKDNGEIAKAVVESADVLKSLVPFIGGLDGRLKAIEKIVNDRPRQASKAQETEINNPELEETIKVGIEGDKTFLGVAVKSGGNGNGSK